jgi:hypothetical protein
MLLIIIIIALPVSLFFFLQMTILTLALGLICTPLTFLLATATYPFKAIYAIFSGEGADVRSIADDASALAWAPLSWASDIIDSMWSALWRFLVPSRRNGRGYPAYAADGDQWIMFWIILVGDIIIGAYLIH